MVYENNNVYLCKVWDSSLKEDIHEGPGVKSKFMKNYIRNVAPW